MRLPLGTGTLYQLLKWVMLFVAFGVFAANIIAPIAAIAFILLTSEGVAAFVSFVAWAVAVGVMLWLVARQGRRTRREGQQRPHTDRAVRRAAPSPQLEREYELLDVGMKPFRTGGRVFRDEAIPDDLPQFYPTVRLWMKRSFAGRLSFEFFDEYGDSIPHFTRSQRVLLLTGHRNITPREPVEMDLKGYPEGVWGMHVRLENHLLAVHEFAWFTVGEIEEPEDDFIYPHAQVAVQRAGAAINDARATLTDIGLLVVRAGGAEANIYRTESLPTDAVAVQPYLRLNLPERAVGVLHFTLRDASGVVHFDYKEQHEYDAGDNLIAARARMRVDDALPVGPGWEMTVQVGETTVARHRFDWRKAVPIIKDPLEEDGEITSRLRDKLADMDEAMSLRELLDEQRRRHKR